MKKIFSIALCCLMAFATLAQAKLNQETRNCITGSWTTPGVCDIVSCKAELQGSVAKVENSMKDCVVMLVNDSVNQYVKAVSLEKTGGCLQHIHFEGNTMIISDPNVSLYIVHINDVTDQNVRCYMLESDIAEEFEAGLDLLVEKMMNKGDVTVLKTLVHMSKRSSGHATGAMLGVLSALRHQSAVSTAKEIKPIKDQQNQQSGNPNQKKEDSFPNRIDIDFHWAFNNWGTTPFNGLIGMSEPGYDLRTSFSSYQLCTKYELVKTKHFRTYVGIGYESDVYKFNNPYVTFENNAFVATENTVPGGYYSSRFVTRYVQLPVGIAYRKNKGFRVGLMAIPALGWTGKHTGLKHEFHTEGRNPQDKTDIKDELNPFKLDIRLEMSIRSFGVFLQVATMPVFIPSENNPTKIYPIKIGFFI
ncbi:MAG: hypothetical protein MJZ67_05625 [Bacteroidales bacterium]|nr:hypothetical protein [Bacteroidales bacterium]